MTDERLFERLTAHAGPADVDHAFEDRLYALLQQERRRSSRSARPALLLVAALLAILMISAAVVIGSGVVELPWLDESPSPSAAASIAPTGSPEPSAPPTVAQLDWTGPLRPDLGQAVVAHTADEVVGDWSWADPRDAAMGWVDITRVGFNETGGAGRELWNIELSSWPPPATGQDGADLIVAHGLVLDTTGDGVADYVVGVDDDAPIPGDFHAWVTNLATGETEGRREPPYGYPVEFAHNAGGLIPGVPPGFSLFFLPGSGPRGLDIGSLRYYVWTSVTEAGRVVAWDYAPDNAWLGSPFVNGWPSGGINRPGEYSFGASSNPNVGRYGWMHNAFPGNAEGEVSIEFSWGELYPSGTTPVTVAGDGGTFQEAIDQMGRRRQVWIVDIEGTSFTITLRAEPKTSAAQLAEARAIIKSIRAVLAPDGDGVRLLIFTLPAGWDSG